VQESVEIYLTQYKFDTVPENAFNFRTNGTVRLKIDLNSNLRLIHPNAFSLVDATFREINIERTGLVEFPNQAFKNAKLGKDVSLLFPINKVSNSPIFQNQEIGFFNLETNKIKSLNSSSFVNVKAYSIDISFNQISLIESSAFVNCTMEYLYLGYNSLLQINQGAISGCNFFKLSLSRKFRLGRSG
jgi:hypothetical protein